MTWLAIKNYEGLYAVSDEGEVMSMNYAKSGLPGLMTQKLCRDYPLVYLRKRGIKGKSIPVHKLVAETFLGYRPRGFQINHIDGNKSNNHVSNLEYCSASDNRKHAFRIGLQSSQGIAHSQAKLNDAAILDIRERITAGETAKSIADIYKVDPSNISHIASGRRWTHVRKAG